MKQKKETKKKVYVLMVSRNFPAYHPRKGQETNFLPMIGSGQKGHTVRINYALWKKRAEKVNAGLAVVSIRFWEGKPRHSPQSEYMELSTINVQKVHIYKVAKQILANSDPNMMMFSLTDFHTQIFIDNNLVPLRHPFKFAAKDGLSLQDFNDWFKKPIEDAAIIHFSNFAY